MQTCGPEKLHLYVSQPSCLPQCIMPSFGLSDLLHLLLLSLLLGNVLSHEESGEGTDMESTAEITAGRRQINFGDNSGTTMGTRRRGTPTSGATYRQTGRRYGNVRRLNFVPHEAIKNVLGCKNPKS